MSKRAYTIPEAAADYGVSDKVIRAAIHSGNLRAKRAGRNKDGDGVGKYLLTTAALDKWFDSLADA